MAGLTWFGTDGDMHSRLLTHLAAQQILRDARRRANAILVFYRGLKDFAANAEARTMIDNMIAEEDRHISAVSRSLDRMQAVGNTPPRVWSLCRCRMTPRVAPSSFGLSDQGVA